LFTDEVYVILVTDVDKKGNVSHHMHIWCGVDSSLDEISVAERKSIELNRFLDSRCVPVREDQGAESKLFLSSFNSLGGIKVVSRSKVPHTRSENKNKQHSSSSSKSQANARLGSGTYLLIN
jgi:hypothetical protein